MAGLSFGYGIGLPLSRLHAKYLGGSLDLVSLPGYGVDVSWKKKSKLASKDGMAGWMYQKWIKLWYCLVFFKQNNQKLMVSDGPQFLN